MNKVLEKNTGSVEKLALAAQELSLARDLDTVIKIVRKAARQLTGADGATFILREGNNCFYADEDAIGPLWKGSRFPLESCISGWCMINKSQVAIPDIFADQRIPHDLYKPTFVKSLVMVPIRTLDPIGAIGNYWASASTPTGNEMVLLQALADITAVTLENIKVYDQLEHRVQERTMELENLNKELESFSYSISHDLRAPLRAINGYLAILLEDHTQQLSEEGQRIAGRVMKNATQMTQLIDDLLSFFKMAKKELLKDEVNMKQMVSAICRSFGQHEKDRHITFTVDELAPGIADSVSIRQVWLNLISNAVKYTGKKENPVIEIGSMKQDGQNVYFVRDNGAGFDMQYASRLFGVFQRLHSQREFEGTGIGLAIVQKIIAKHGGRVWVEAKEDAGATFYFTLSQN